MRRELARFKRRLRAGKATRADWPLWCWICGEPQVCCIGDEGSPLYECNRCYERTDALAALLEREAAT